MPFDSTAEKCRRMFASLNWHVKEVITTKKKLIKKISKTWILAQNAAVFWCT